MSSASNFLGTTSSQEAEQFAALKKAAWASEDARREREGLPLVTEDEKKGKREKVWAFMDKVFLRREKVVGKGVGEGLPLTGDGK